MAASGATPIILYHSTTGAAVPSNTNLSPGELAVNIADMKLYCENDSGVVTLLSSADAAAGNFTTVDINGGTIDGTVIGGSTAAAGSFTTLGASSTATFAAGAEGTPAITTTGDTNTGIFFPAADTIAFAEGGAEAMRIDSSGNVGIGTSSPSVKFEVNGRVLGESVVAGNALYVWSQDRMSLGASYGIESQQSSPFFLLTNSAQPIVFGTNNTERMRITSIGDFYIGRTSDTDGAGLTLDVSGFIRCNRDGATPMVVNRNTDDGTLISLRQAGTPVGEIGTTGGELYIDFGGSTGGAVTSRTLDDYEEGSFTPAFTFSTSGSVTYSTQEGTYTKIGRLVHCTIAFVLSGVSSPTGDVGISGLPFTNGSGEGFVSAGSKGVIRSLTISNAFITVYVSNNLPTLVIAKNDTNAGGTSLQGSDLQAGTLFYLSVIYQSA
jgi:hypothetical protein